MNLHEYQAKQLFREFSIPVPEGSVVKNLVEALAVYDEMNIGTVVVKAQVHAGGRGKAGGVKIVNNKDELSDIVKKLLGSQLVTYQTDANGQPVNQILLEAPSTIKTELYLSMLVDRASQTVTIVASSEGGVDIETVANETPEKITQVSISPIIGVLPYIARDLGKKLGFDKDQTKQFFLILKKMYDLFLEKDLAMIEINPLIINGDNQLVCLDAKVSADENALYRQKEIAMLHDPSQEDDRENHAKKWDLNYVHLDGNIGCMVNGAGLAMATMDIIKVSGGEPANFLDVGGSATAERVTEGFKIILSDTNVKGIFVNIFGGIVKCDLIADGIIEASKQCKLDIPVVVRLVGNNAELGSEKLNESGLNLIAINDLNEATKCIVEKVGELS